MEIKGKNEKEAKRREIPSFSSNILSFLPQLSKMDFVRVIDLGDRIRIEQLNWHGHHLLLARFDPF